jgi:two-component system, cell cycle sensor histidine kinase and response regulator CckA
VPDQRIMIVEDEHIVALDIRKQVENHGYVVAGIHASGEAALADIVTAKPDLILMDIRLQGELDGLQTAKIINDKHSIPVVMLTAYADDATLHRAKLAQPFAYIIKPFEERELRTAIIMALYRHRMEQMVVQRERLFNTTLENIADAVIVTDEAHRIEFLNSVACEMLRLDAVGTIGTIFDEQIALRVRPRSNAGPDSGAGSVATGIGDLKTEYEVVLPGGRFVPVEKTSTALVDGDGHARGWVCVLHDISGRLEIEGIVRSQNERLRRSQKMEAIGRLTGGIAHDFNNLLTVIMGYSRLIIDELDDVDAAVREAIVEDVEGIRSAAIRSAALTRQMLAFSRSEPVERRPTDLNEVLAGMESIFGQLLKEDITLTVQPTGGSSVVFADPTQLEQVIMNLTVNASDSMPEGGRLLIRTEGRRVALAEVIGRDGVEPGDFVSLTISDTGSGMDAVTAERVFDPFFTTKSAGKGTGLGLSTVYGIVTQSRGFVDVESRPGEGTTFTVCLPAHLSGDVDGDPDSDESEPDTGAETILLVEDDDAIRTLVARLLRSKGYQVVDAANAGEALLEVENLAGPLHLLLSDIVMPLMSGVKLAMRLRETLPDIKVILMSGYPDSTLSEKERLESGFHFLQKPVDPETLTRTLREILDG